MQHRSRSNSRDEIRYPGFGSKMKKFRGIHKRSWNFFMKEYWFSTVEIHKRLIR